MTGATSNRQTDKKMLAKVDWKISDKHRLTARYSKTDGLVPQFGNLGGGVTINGVSSPQIGTSPTGHFYNQTRVGKSYSGQLNSDWTPDFKTEIRFVPNDAAQKSGSAKAGSEEEGETPTATRLPKPEVVAQVSVKDRSKDGRRS